MPAVMAMQGYRQCHLKKVTVPTGHVTSGCIWTEVIQIYINESQEWRQLIMAMSHTGV